MDEEDQLAHMIDVEVERERHACDVDAVEEKKNIIIWTKKN
jgi:hypothetical protein